MPGQRLIQDIGFAGVAAPESNISQGGDLVDEDAGKPSTMAQLYAK